MTFARADLRARIIERARAEASPTRAEVVRRRRIFAVPALSVPLLVFIAAGGVRASQRPSELVLETVLGSAILATGAAVIGLGRGRSMLGRPRSHLVAVSLFTPVLLLGWKTLVSSRFPGMTSEWPDRPGLRCLVLSIALVLAPLFCSYRMRWNSDPVHPGASAAALGAAAGAGAWVLVDLWCPVSYAPHLLLGHVLPLVATTLASVAIGSRILTMRSR